MKKKTMNEWYAMLCLTLGMVEVIGEKTMNNDFAKTQRSYMYSSCQKWSNNLSNLVQPKEGYFIIPVLPNL